MVDQIKLVNLGDQSIFKGTDGLMHIDGNAEIGPDLNQRLKSGFLEGSNVNAVHELTSMISLSRQFEVNLKMMKAAEENSEAATKILQLS